MKIIEKINKNKNLLTVVIFAFTWIFALIYSSISARALYADGAYAVLNSFLTPNRFDDYDAQRTFASFIIQAPLLFGQRMGFDGVYSYAILYSLGLFVFPALLMIWALYILRRQILSLSFLCFCILAYGFGVNFINSEANIMFGLVLISVAILVGSNTAHYLRGYFLPLIAFALLFVYEGMLLVGPFLAFLAVIAFKRQKNTLERIGLVISALLFILGAVVGLGGFLAPRDANNASGFLSQALTYLKHPQFLILLSGIMAALGVNIRHRVVKIIFLALSFCFAVGFFWGVIKLDGYYSYSVYYYNRSFLVFLMPIVLAVVCFANYYYPLLVKDATISVNSIFLVVPLLFVVAGDVLGTYRWNIYVKQFCMALDSPMSSSDRLKYLQSTGAVTGWAWTHPTMSILLRKQGDTSIVANDPAAFSWEPFKHDNAPLIKYRGLCEDF